MGERASLWDKPAVEPTPGGPDARAAFGSPLEDPGLPVTPFGGIRRPPTETPTISSGARSRFDHSTSTDPPPHGPLSSTHGPMQRTTHHGTTARPTHVTYDEVPETAHQVNFQKEQGHANIPKEQGLANALNEHGAR